MENLINIVSKNFKNLLDKYSLQADQLLQIASEYLQKETFYQKTNDTIGKKLFITPHSCYKDIVKNKNMHLKEQYLCDICRFDCQYKKNDTDKNKDCGYCVPILEYVFSINKETLDHTLQILNDITTANHPNRIYSNLESNQPHDQPIKKYFNQFQTINQLKDFFTNEIEDENLILNLDQEQP